MKVDGVDNGCNVLLKLTIFLVLFLNFLFVMGIGVICFLLLALGGKRVKKMDLNVYIHTALPGGEKDLVDGRTDGFRLVHIGLRI